MVSSCRNATTWHAGVVVCWDASAKGLAHAGLVMLGREGSWCLVHRSKQADVHVPPLCSPASALEWNILCRTPLTAPPVCNQQHQAAGQQQWGRATASRGRCHAHPSASPGPQVHSSLFMQADVASTWGRQAACVSPSLPSKGLQWHALSPKRCVQQGVLQYSHLHPHLHPCNPHSGASTRWASYQACGLPHGHGLSPHHPAACPLPRGVRCLGCRAAGACGRGCSTGQVPCTCDK